MGIEGWAMAEEEKAKGLSQDKALDMMMKISEYADRHITKTIFFIAFAFCVKVWRFNFEAVPQLAIRLTEASRSVAIGLLGWVGMFHLFLSINFFVQTLDFGKHVHPEAGIYCFTNVVG
jgi:hypothetical protein